MNLRTLQKWAIEAVAQTLFLESLALPLVSAMIIMKHSKQVFPLLLLFNIPHGSSNALGKLFLIGCGGGVVHCLGQGSSSLQPTESGPRHPWHASSTSTSSGGQFCTAVIVLAHQGPPGSKRPKPRNPEL